MTKLMILEFEDTILAARPVTDDTNIRQYDERLDSLPSGCTEIFTNPDDDYIVIGLSDLSEIEFDLMDKVGDGWVYKTQPCRQLILAWIVGLL